MKISPIALALLLLAALSAAAPLPTQLIENHDLQQCSRFLPGDECMDCTPPQGWTALPEGSSCPEGYTSVDVRGNCTAFQAGHCCTEGHSGASGDCRNMVINDMTGQCSFAEDGANALPAGWERMPANASPQQWLCPTGYGWTADPATAAGGNASAGADDAADDNTTDANASYSGAAAASTISRFGPVNIASVANDTDFSVTSGKNISGWSWLTQPGQSASWNFYSLPADRSLYIYLTPLVTRPSGLGGGSGYSTDVRITYTTSSGIRNSTVALKNTHHELQMPADTQGWGYQTTGSLKIPADRINPDGRLTVTLTKLPNAEDVAVNRECCTVEFV